MQAWQCDKKGILIGPVECQPSPREKDVWLVPAQATLVAPPEPKAGKQCVFDFERQVWETVDVKAEASPDVVFNKLNPAQKLAAVKDKADSLLVNCHVAMERILWAEWMGNPFSESVKLEWAKYRHALLSIPTAEQDQKFFIKLKTLEAFPWPEQPQLPDEAIP